MKKLVLQNYNIYKEPYLKTGPIGDEAVEQHDGESREWWQHESRLLQHAAFLKTATKLLFLRRYVQRVLRWGVCLQQSFRTGSAHEQTHRRRQKDTTILKQYIYTQYFMNISRDN